MPWTRDRAETLALPVDALALRILESFRDDGGWNWQNWLMESQQYGAARDAEVFDALAEGWAWLITHGLVA